MAKSESGILSRLRKDLEDYLALGSDTPVAPEAQNLLDALSGGGGGKAPAGAGPTLGAAEPKGPVTPEPAGGGGVGLMGAAAGGPPPGPPPGGFRTFGAARAGAMSDLTSAGGLANLANLRRRRGAALPPP
jgi:hypothetical protein